MNSIEHLVPIVSSQQIPTLTNDTVPIQKCTVMHGARVECGATHPLYVEVGQRRVHGTLAQPRADHGLDDSAEQNTVYPGRGDARAFHRALVPRVEERSVAQSNTCYVNTTHYLYNTRLVAFAPTLATARYTIGSCDRSSLTHEPVHTLRDGRGTIAERNAVCHQCKLIL